TAEVNAIHKAINDWYIQDYKTYKSIVNNQDSNYINGTETYAKVALLTKTNTSGERNFISINTEIVNKKYKPAIIMTLTLIIAIIFSSS
ncbi:GNVR domain-containing protein, partial [Escherichia coli]